MVLPDWVAQNWFDTSQTLAIIVSLFTTLYTLRTEKKERLLANSFELTKSHRELWTFFSSKPELRRILHEKKKRNPSPVEVDFITLLILHLKLAHQATKSRLYKPPQGMEADVQSFFSKPIPRRVWEQRKSHYDPDFVHFVDRLLSH